MGRQEHSLVHRGSGPSVSGFLVVSAQEPWLETKGAVRKGKWQTRGAGPPRPLGPPELVTVAPASQGDCSLENHSPGERGG